MLKMFVLNVSLSFAIMVHLAFYGSISGKSGEEETCYNRFDYEYKVIQNIVQLRENQTRLLETIQQQHDQIQNLLRVAQDTTNKVRRLDESGSHGGASTYVRWGRTTCPENGTERVYSGIVGGSHYSHTGAAVDYLCLPLDPLWAHYEDTRQDGAIVYGAEYELNFRTNQNFFPNHDHSLRQRDVPCAVCRSTRASVLMIPGRNECYAGWTLEYWGYLTAGYYGHPAASEYACLDTEPESPSGDNVDLNGKLFYFVEGRCGSLNCSPYVDGRELTCAVCTK